MIINIFQSKKDFNYLFIYFQQCVPGILGSSYTCRCMRGFYGVRCELYTSNNKLNYETSTKIGLKS